MLYLCLNKNIAGNFLISKFRVKLNNYTLNTGLFTLYVNESNLDAVLLYIYNDLSSFIYFNNVTYKTKKGAANRIKILLNK